MTDQKSSIGRTVHYTSHGTPDGTYGKECRAAIVTAVCDNPGGHDPETDTPCASLAVLNPTGMFFNEHVPQEELADKIEPGPSGRTGGTWHWPERV